MGRVLLSGRSRGCAGRYSGVLCLGFHLLRPVDTHHVACRMQQHAVKVTQQLSAYKQQLLDMMPLTLFVCRCSLIAPRRDSDCDLV